MCLSANQNLEYRVLCDGELWTACDRHSSTAYLVLPATKPFGAFPQISLGVKLKNTRSAYPDLPSPVAPTLGVESKEGDGGGGVLYSVRSAGPTNELPSILLRLGRWRRGPPLSAVLTPRSLHVSKELVFNTCKCSPTKPILWRSVFAPVNRLC